MEGKQCEMRCPRRTLLDVELRDSRRRGIAGAGALAVEGAQYAAQLARTLICPQRLLSEDSWVPAQACADYVRQVLARRTIDSAVMTDYEKEALGLYMPGAPGPRTEDGPESDPPTDER